MWNVGLELQRDGETISHMMLSLSRLAVERLRKNSQNQKLLGFQIRIRVFFFPPFFLQSLQISEPQCQAQLGTSLNVRLLYGVGGWCVKQSFSSVPVQTKPKMTRRSAFSLSQWEGFSISSLNHQITGKPVLQNWSANHCLQSLEADNMSTLFLHCHIFSPEFCSAICRGWMTSTSATIRSTLSLLRYLFKFLFVQLVLLNQHLRIITPIFVTWALIIHCLSYRNFWGIILRNKLFIFVKLDSNTLECAAFLLHIPPLSVLNCFQHIRMCCFPSSYPPIICVELLPAH